MFNYCVTIEKKSNATNNEAYIGLCCFFFYLCVCEEGGCRGTHLEVRRQLARVGSFLSHCEFQGSSPQQSINDLITQTKTRILAESSNCPHLQK